MLQAYKFVQQLGLTINLHCALFLWNSCIVNRCIRLASDCLHATTCTLRISPRYGAGSAETKKMKLAIAGLVQSVKPNVRDGPNSRLAVR